MNPSKNDRTEDKDSDEEEELKPEEKEVIKENENFTKLFQKLIEKLKIVKGVSSVEKIPSRKMNGYLSIERQNNLSDGISAPLFLVFRDFAGNMHFTGLLNKSVARIREMNEKEHVFKLKIAVTCLDPSTR